MSPQPSTRRRANAKANGDDTEQEDPTTTTVDDDDNGDDDDESTGDDTTAAESDGKVYYTPPEDPQTSPEKQIARAMMLEQQRATLMESIGKNRDYLRLMAANEELSEGEGSQFEWLAAFYPEKEKGQVRSKVEIAATRAVK